MAAPLTLLCVHPHPDDETIACGGIIARYLDEGAEVMVVTCTGGEEGENLAGIDLGEEEMAEVRRRELVRALEILGGPAHEFLGYRDSGMLGTDANAHPDSFQQAEVDEAAARLATIIRSFRPSVVVSDDEQGTYGHPDHVKAHRVVARAVELAATDGDGPGWQVPKRYVHALPRSRLFAFQQRMEAAGLPSPFGDQEVSSVDELPFGVPDETISAVIDVRTWLERKRAAMRAHASQIGEESFFLNLPSELGSEVFGYEHFVLVDGQLGGAPEDDLFAGLR